MRQVKFRGKGVNRDWVYGYVVPRSIFEDPDHLNELWIARRRQEVNLFNYKFPKKKLNYIFILL